MPGFISRTEEKDFNVLITQITAINSGENALKLPPDISGVWKEMPSWDASDGTSS